MPDRLVALLAKFLNQSNGSLSKRDREKEFLAVTEEEVKRIEEVYREVFQ